MIRHDNVNTYNISTARAHYAVTLQRLKNTTSGGPRFRAFVIVLSRYYYKDGSPALNVAASEYMTAHYTFKGSYLSEYEEAKKAVAAYEQEITK